MPEPVVGFIGLGRMGRPMATRIARAGFTLRAFDSDARAACALDGTGAEVVADAAAAATGVDVLILMLPDSAAVTAVLIGDGVLARMGSGAVVADMSSSRPAVTARLAAEAAARGVALVDAPVSGGVTGAEAGTLTIMAGGEAFAVQRCAALFGVLAHAVLHVGGPGTGHTVKALNNMLMAASLLSAAEALAIARAAGIDPQRFAEAVNVSTGRSWSTEHKLPRFLIPEDYSAGFALRLLVKDLGIAAEVADGAEVGAPLVHELAELWERAAATLEPDADHTAIGRWVQEAQR